MFWTLYPRDAGYQHRVVLTGIQVPPSPLWGTIVARADSPTLRTDQILLFVPFQEHPDLFIFGPNFNRIDVPRGF
jgi:hypothetical protein